MCVVCMHNMSGHCVYLLGSALCGPKGWGLALCCATPTKALLGVGSQEVPCRLQRTEVLSRTLAAKYCLAGSQ